MPECRKCQQKFPNRIKIEGKVKNIGRRKYCLDCSPFGSHNTRKLEIEQEGILDFKLCKWCGETKSKEEFYIRSDRNSLYYYCKKCSNERDKVNQKIRSRERKIKLIMLKGGKCQSCGYDKNLAALVFHHRDPSLKEYELSTVGLRISSWSKCLKEAEKCNLLCQNCHLEFHYPQHSDWRNDL